MNAWAAPAWCQPTECVSTWMCFLLSLSVSLLLPLFFFFFSGFCLFALLQQIHWSEKKRGGGEKKNRRRKECLHSLAFWVFLSDTLLVWSWHAATYAHTYTHWHTHTRPSQWSSVDAQAHIQGSGNVQINKWTHAVSKYDYWHPFAAGPSHAVGLTLG